VADEPDIAARKPEISAGLTAKAEVSARLDSTGFNNGQSEPQGWSHPTLRLAFSPLKSLLHRNGNGSGRNAVRDDNKSARP
jgi:hypothetical protein